MAFIERKDHQNKLSKVVTKIGRGKEVCVTPFRGDTYIHLTDLVKGRSISMSIRELKQLTDLYPTINEYHASFHSKGTVDGVSYPVTAHTLSEYATPATMSIGTVDGVSYPVTAHTLSEYATPATMSIGTADGVSYPVTAHALADYATPATMSIGTVDGVSYPVTAHALADYATPATMSIGTVDVTPFDGFPADDEIFLAIPVTLPQ